VSAESLAVSEQMVDVGAGRVWVRSTGGSGRTPAVVLHGGPGSPSDYLVPFETLADERQLVLYDQLGCGRSDAPDDESLWTVERFVGELETVLDALGLRRVHLIGHSWGAMLAVDFALQHPSRVASLVLDSACLSMDRVRADMERLKAALPDALRKVIADHEARGTTSSGAYGAATMAFYRRHICRLPVWPEPLQKSQTAWNFQVYRTMWGPSELLPIGNLRDYEREARLIELRAPALYLCGRHDEMTPESAAAYQAATPNAELVVFENSAHVQHLEEPDAFFATVRDFLRRVDRIEGENA
jgi:proline iminopeptidase